MSLKDPVTARRLTFTLAPEKTMLALDEQRTFIAQQAQRYPTKYGPSRCRTIATENRSNLDRAGDEGLAIGREVGVIAQGVANAKRQRDAEGYAADARRLDYIEKLEKCLD